MASRVEHVGIAVADLEAGIRLYRDLLGLELERVEEVASEGVRVAFLRCGGGESGHVELLCPTGSGGAIARFLERNGPGLHHLAVAVADVPAALAACAAAGVATIDREPRVGAGGRPVAFVHPCAAGGVLIELCGPLPTRG
jgi:methylmalonyl-CoA/ethylmalonyl-CoA epimerase